MILTSIHAYGTAVVQTMIVQELEKNATNKMAMQTLEPAESHKRQHLFQVVIVLQHLASTRL